MLKKYFFFTLITISSAIGMEDPSWGKRLGGMADLLPEDNNSSLYTDSSRLTDEEVKQALAQCPAEIMDIFNCYRDNKSGASTNALSNKFHNVLMFDGPPGTGKSTLARAFAQGSEVPFTFVCCAALSNEYKHSGRTNVIETFKQILERHAAHVLIMDEIQSVLYRQENNLLNPEVAEAVWSQLDTCFKRKELMVIFTGNDHEILPPQLKSRIYRFGFKLPTLDERKSLIQFILNSEYQNCHDLSECAVNQIAKKTAHFSIRDIEKMFARSAANCRIRVRNSALPYEINSDDAQKAIAFIKLDERFSPWYKSLGTNLRPALGPALQIGIPLIGNMIFQCVLHREGLTQAREFHNGGLIQQREFQKQNLMMQAVLAFINLQHSKQLHEQSLAHSQNLQTQSITHNETSAESQNEKQAIQTGLAIGGFLYNIFTAIYGSK